MINRRGFVASILGTSAIASVTAVGDVSAGRICAKGPMLTDPKPSPPFECRRVITLWGTLSGGDKLEQRRWKRLHRLFGKDVLNMSPDKVCLLERMTGTQVFAYVDADRDDWLRRLIRRESLCSSYSGPHIGLMHQSPSQDQQLSKVRYRSFKPAIEMREPHWWVFLVPEGTKYNSSDDVPVHVIFSLVMPWPDPLLRAQQLFRFTLMTRRIQANEEPSQFWRQLAVQDQADVADQLSEHWFASAASQGLSPWSSPSTSA